MNMFLLAKRIHRWTLFPTVGLGLAQVATGLAMKYGLEGMNTRALHNQTSGYFVFFLLVQMVTGVMMYVIPLIPKKQTTETGNI